MSNLHQVLSEYSVPLQIWLAPEARNKVADVLISEMGDKAHIHPHPLPQIDGLRGPAVLVITANEINGSGQDALRVLAQKAHPGRGVLIVGNCVF